MGGRQDDEPEKDNEEEKRSEIVTPVVWDPNDGTAWPRPTG